jgi:hypothetical protein
MTFAAVGSSFAQTSTSWSLTPAGVGNFILVEVISETAADWATALSSSNVTWSVLVAPTTVGADVSTVFIGQVTAASAATVTVTLNTGTPTLRIAGQEFSTSAGYSSVSLDTSGTATTSTLTYPSLTPTHGSGELYFGYAVNAGTAVAGSTSGYTYYVDANGNGLCFDASCTSSAQAPVWGGSAAVIDGISVLLSESGPAPNGISGSWVIAFDDEFPGSTLDTTKWYVGTWSGNNVTFSGANVTLTNPGLVLTVASATSGAQIQTLAYQLPVGGCCEARVWFPGPGAPTPGNTIYNWPAWWTSDLNTWPAAGEIDIAESYGGTLTNNYHSPSGSHNGPSPGPAGNWSNSWHTYGMYRASDHFDIYFDGVRVYTFTPTDDNGISQNLLLTAGSGNTAAYGTASQVKVSYVRAWVPASVSVSSSDAGTGSESESTALVQSNQANSGSTLGSSQVVTLPHGVVTGNLLVASVACGGNLIGITPPAGWSLAVINQPYSPATIETSIWYAVVTSGMAGTTSWTFTFQSPVTMSVAMSEFYSAHGWSVTPLDQVATGSPQAASGSSPYVSSPSATVDSGTTPLTAQAQELWVASLAHGGAGQSLSGYRWKVAVNSPGGGSSQTQLHTTAKVIGSANSSLQLGSSPAYWAGSVATFMPAVPALVSSQDSGTGSDAHASAVVALTASDAATGVDSSVGNPSSYAVFSSDSGGDAGSLYGTGLYGAGLYSYADSETQQVAPLLPLQSTDFGNGYDAGGIASMTRPPLPAIPIFEGFSLSRVAVLGATGLENAQLVGAQSITITPTITSSDMKADDDEYGTWYVMSKADLVVVNGFMSWSAISQLAGIAVASSGVSPLDYYGLPLWTQYQHNRPVTPMAFRMASRDSRSGARTLDFVLYRVQLSVLDYTGTVYKQGLGVSYKGTVTFSSVDEVGNALPHLEIGRMVASPGQLSGTFGPVALQGV